MDAQVFILTARPEGVWSDVRELMELPDGHFVVWALAVTLMAAVLTSDSDGMSALLGKPGIIHDPCDHGPLLLHRRQN